MNASTLVSGSWLMSPPPVHVDATSVAEAVSLLAGAEGKAAVIAGGTDLVSRLKDHLASPRVLVNIKTIPGLCRIAASRDGLSIGALATLDEISRSTIVSNKHPIIAEAAASVGSPHIRNMGTLGGNLCQETRCWYFRRSPLTGTVFKCWHNGGRRCVAIQGENQYHAIFGQQKCSGVCPSDMALALLALDASLRTSGPGGDRTLPVAEFYRPMGNVLGPAEIITQIVVPPQPPSARQHYTKFTLRRTIDFALVSAAAVISVKRGVADDARIVLGGVATAPYRALKAEALLNGQKLTGELAQSAGDAAVAGAVPLSGNRYKLVLARTLVSRVIMACKNK